jgi:hypothetical protein
VSRSGALSKSPVSPFQPRKPGNQTAFARQLRLNHSGPLPPAPVPVHSFCLRARARCVRTWASGREGDMHQPSPTHGRPRLAPRARQPGSPNPQTSGPSCCPLSKFSPLIAIYPDSRRPHLPTTPRHLLHHPSIHRPHGRTPSRSGSRISPSGSFRPHKCPKSRIRKHLRTEAPAKKSQKVVESQRKSQKVPSKSSKVEKSRAKVVGTSPRLSPALSQLPISASRVFPPRLCASLTYLSP